MRTITLRFLVIVLAIPFAALAFATLFLLFCVSPLVWVVDGHEWLFIRFGNRLIPLVERILGKT